MHFDHVYDNFHRLSSKNNDLFDCFCHRSIYSSCCTLDWFQAWPEDALERVAKKYLEQVDIKDTEKDACVDIVKYFHTSTQKLSEKFYSKLQRYNYVTPTSYLQAISGFKMLITQKQNEIMAAKKRYVKGLDQLAFAEQQVS